MKIGDTVWVFDINRRVYPPKKPGEIYSAGGPIYREHWSPCTIIGETSRSWLAGYEHRPYKIPKKGPHRGYAFSEQEVEDDCWLNDHKHVIIRQLSHRPLTVEQVKSIAAMIGYSADS